MEFYIHAHYEGFIQGIQIQADNVHGLLYKLQVTGKLEEAHQVRQQAVRVTDPSHCHITTPNLAAMLRALQYVASCVFICSVAFTVALTNLCHAPLGAIALLGILPKAGGNTVYKGISPQQDGGFRNLQFYSDLSTGHPSSPRYAIKYSRDRRRICCGTVVDQTRASGIRHCPNVMSKYCAGFHMPAP